MRTIMKYLVYGIFAILLLSCSADVYDTDVVDIPRKEYTCKKGTHDFRPNPSILPRQAGDMIGTAVLTESCWYNSLGADNADWNKLAGLYRYNDYNKNRNSFILAWRPDTNIVNHFQLCLYENIKGGNRAHEEKIYTVQAGQRFTFRFLLRSGKYVLTVDDEPLGVQENPIRYGVIGLVSAWFGGTSTAPHDMKLYMIF